MKIKDCPECKNPVGLVSSMSSWWDTTDPRRIILQCGSSDVLLQLEEWEANGFPDPCGYEAELPADIEAHMEERPRLFK